MVFRRTTAELYLTQASIADTYTEEPMLNEMTNAAMLVLMRVPREMVGVSVDPDSRTRNVLKDVYSPSTDSNWSPRFVSGRRELEEDVHLASANNQPMR